MNDQVKKLIQEAKNICVIPSQEPESLTSALALFYTLKELQKNVNLMVDNLPARLQFLVPSLDHITQPKNFVISIPRSIADVSQIYYEKNEDFLKIHLTAAKGFIKKDDVSLYVSNAKPDVVVTLGIQDFRAQLATTLDSFGFLLDAPVINIDNKENNIKFGQVNIVEQRSIPELLLTHLLPATFNQSTANCILAGIISSYENLKSSNTTSDTFQLVSELIKKGADYNQVISNLSKPTERELYFIHHIFKNLGQERGVALSQLPNEFQDFSESEASVAVEKLKAMGFSNELLVVWPSHNSDPAIKGFFYSKKAHLINKFAEHPHGTIKNDWVFLSFPGEDITSVKEQILTKI